MESNSDELRLALSGRRIVLLEKNEDRISGLLRTGVPSGYCYVATGHVEASQAWKHLLYWDAEARTVRLLDSGMVVYEAYRLIAPDNVHDILGYFTTKEENVNCVETVYVYLKTSQLLKAGLPTTIAEPEPEESTTSSTLEGSGDAVEPIE